MPDPAEIITYLAQNWWHILIDLAVCVPVCTTVCTLLDRRRK